MAKFNDLSRSLVALAEDSTFIAAIELSRSSWLIGALVPGLRRDPRKKLPPGADTVLGLLHRWRDEAIAAVARSSGSAGPTKSAVTGSGGRAGCAAAALSAR
jgi:hypothetical protein